MQTLTQAQPQDVYAVPPPGENAGRDFPEAGITVLLERTPTALARVFSLLCTVDLVPASSCAARSGDDELRLDFAFDAVPATRFDMLIRKISQLTECLEVSFRLERRRAAA